MAGIANNFVMDGDNNHPMEDADRKKRGVVKGRKEVQMYEGP